MAGAIYVKDGTPVTGSFSKIQITSNAGAGLAGAGAKFDDIQWGRGNLADDDGTNNHLSKCHIHNDIEDMPVTGSIIIEGPIIGFHLVEGEVLAYYQ
tara:strand:- start:367 stop:657 length:291 start_codon:yes stop_codon:yes gene_type:complete